MSGQRRIQADFSSPGSSKSLLSFASPTPEKLSPNQSLYAKPWPSRPQPLQKRVRGWTWWETIVDFVTVLIPFPFFMLAATVIAVNGKRVEDHDLKILERSIKGATTLFPLCFAAVVGRAAVKYATWKLERGTTLGALEQLMGSRTVASTIITQLQLRSFNLVGVGLILIWSLSPLGGQSILHILSTPMKPLSNTTNVGYFNSRQQSYATPNGAFRNLWFPGYTVLFGSSLLSPVAVKRSTMDTWGNVKIPYYSSASMSNPGKDIDGWTQISPSMTPVYSSLFGIPLSGLGLGNTTLTVESSYVELSCGNMTKSNQSSPDGQFIKTNWIGPQGPFVSFRNVSAEDPWALGYRGLDATTLRSNTEPSYIRPQSCPDCLPTDLANSTFDSGSLLYQEFAGFDNTTSVFCTPSQSYVESAVFCSKTADSQNCRVTAQRPSQLPHMPPEITYLSFPRIAQGITSLLPNSTPQLEFINQIQNYLYNPDSEAAIISGDASIFRDSSQSPLQDLSVKDFGDRLGQLLNTFLYSSLWNSTAYITGAPFEGIVGNPVGGRNASFIPATSADLTAMMQNRTSAFTVQAVLTTEFPVYRCDYAWIVVFLFSNFIMFLAAITGVVFSRRTIVPDYLGYVSSLARESPYMRMPDEGVNMDGMDKARLVKDVKVRLGDVSDAVSGSSVGRLAFARMEETVKVKKGKLYV